MPPQTPSHPSCPLTNLLFILAEKAGKTLHLLKSGSKPIKPRSKRQKFELLGTLAQYNDSKKKPQPLKA